MIVQSVNIKMSLFARSGKAIENDNAKSQNERINFYILCLSFFTLIFQLYTFNDYIRIPVLLLKRNNLFPREMKNGKERHDCLRARSLPRQARKTHLLELGNARYNLADFFFKRDDFLPHQFFLLSLFYERRFHPGNRVPQCFKGERRTGIKKRRRDPLFAQPQKKTSAVQKIRPAHAAVSLAPQLV